MRTFAFYAVVNQCKSKVTHHKPAQVLLISTFKARYIPNFPLSILNINPNAMNKSPISIFLGFHCLRVTTNNRVREKSNSSNRMREKWWKKQQQEVAIEVNKEAERKKRNPKRTFSFLKRVRMLPSSLSTRSLSCSLFWQLRISLMNTESPRIPDIAIAYGARRSLSSLSLQIPPKLDWDCGFDRIQTRIWAVVDLQLQIAETRTEKRKRRGRRRIQLCYGWSRERNSLRGER